MNIKQAIQKVQRAQLLIDALYKIATPILFDAETDKQSRDFILVYRIQNEKGEGPFWSRDAWPKTWDGRESTDYTIFNQLANFSELPIPKDDQGFTLEEREEKNWKEKFFAFISPEDAGRYIDKRMWLLLQKNNFKLVPIKASFVVHSPTSGQVYFTPMASL